MFQHICLINDNHANNAVSIYIGEKLGRKLNDIDHALISCVVLGLFDDVRVDLVSYLATQTPDWMFNVRFLHLSVVIPCFNMGLVLSRKTEWSPQIIKWSKMKSTWKGKSPLIQRQYKSLAFMYAGLLFKDLFNLFRRMTLETINAIDLRKILPEMMFDDDNSIIRVCNYCLDSTVGHAFAVKDKSDLYLIESKFHKISPILRLLPLRVLPTLYDKGRVKTHDGERFGVASLGVNSTFETKFWSKPADTDKR